jgi:signal transduction histidine kinase
MILLVGLAAWYFTGRALKPVEAIRLQAESITGTTMHRRVPEPETDDEVGRLARTMNAMLTRLEMSAQKQRQFVSDASHELRSPIASIRTNLEVALHNPERTDWPAVAQRALSEDVRMEDTVSELLDLARLDEAEGPAPIDTLPEVDLDELVLDDTVQQRRVPVDTGRVSAGGVHGRRDPSRGPRPGVRALHPPRRRSRPGCRRSRARPGDGEGDHRAPRGYGLDRGRADRRRPSAGEPPRRMSRAV